MRVLTEQETSQVNGGNPWAFFSIAGAYQIGYGIGESVNAYSASVNDSSLGEAIYYLTR